MLETAVGSATICAVERKQRGGESEETWSSRVGRLKQAAIQGSNEVAQ